MAVPPSLSVIIGKATDKLVASKAAARVMTDSVMKVRLNLKFGLKSTPSPAGSVSGSSSVVFPAGGVLVVSPSSFSAEGENDVKVLASVSLGLDPSRERGKSASIGAAIVGRLVRCVILRKPAIDRVIRTVT
jgi:hypothetical protein